VETSDKFVTCTDCKREARCLRMGDGTEYKPYAWSYLDSAQPMVGVCPLCKSRRAAARMVSAASEDELRALLERDDLCAQAIRGLLRESAPPSSMPPDSRVDETDETSS